ncbi:hypothetical protein HW115_17115 [Verrucomicrobiaceae bacterium N1E253]|uniref:F5/8 type C domain-containing protein n=1 Tax=Oceaniferula marina TaxID=2748318 RepID=A0A851GSW3_9BACT|nr:discoidin domain-containing protein [Oceaniferula marina]NWK57344.1 hypothetical protein [Oceaniferula marina]
MKPLPKLFFFLLARGVLPVLLLTSVCGPIHADDSRKEGDDKRRMSPVPGALSRGQMDPVSLGLMRAGKYHTLRQRLHHEIKLKLAEGELDDLSDELLVLCAQHELLRVSDDAAVIRDKDKGDLFMTELLANPEWIQDLLCSGPVADPGKTLGYLHTVWRYERKSIDTPLYRKLAAACALIGRSDYDVVHAFRNYRKAHQDELLQWGFDELEPWELRHVIAQIPQQDWDYIINERNNKANTYFGACWAVAYRKYNDFGTSIHARGYYTPWDWATQRLEGRALVGGVCGSCSTYGSHSTKVHGYPSYTAGEPGHCAYVIRTKRDNWRTAYSVTGHTRPHGCFWRPFVYSDLHLMEAAYASKVPLRKGYHYLWLSRVVTNPSYAKRCYEQSLRANPLNLGVWIDYAAWLEKQGLDDDEVWKTYAKGVMKAFVRFPDVIVYLNGRFCFKHFKKETPVKQRVQMVKYIQNSIYQLKETRTHQNFATDVKVYEKFVDGENESVFLLYQMLLKLSMEQKKNRDFLTVFDSMRKRFSSSKGFASRYQKTLEHYASSDGDQGNELLKVVVSSIEDSLKRRDYEGYKNNMKVVGNMLDLKDPKHRGLGRWLNKCPKHDPFPGKIISSDAMLWPSTVGKSNRVISYASILNGTHGGGTCQTGSTSNPTIDLALPGACRISGLVITSGYESKTWIERMNPVVVSVSDDRKKWKMVYRSDKAMASHRVDLTGKDIQAKYVRIESPSPDKSTKKQLVLRQLIVYGASNY